MYPPLLVTQGLEVNLIDGNLPLVSGVSIEIEPRTWTMVVGRSGSGKSITLRAILGLLPRKTYHVDGQITFDGKPLQDDVSGDAYAASGGGITMIFQDPAIHLNPLMTIGQHLDEVLNQVRRSGSSSQPVESVSELLRMVRFSDPDRITASYPHQLSGGQKQRAMIALALAPRPKLLLADEPTSSLDATTQREIIELIEELRRESGLTVLMVTHDMGLALTLSDKIYVMDEGRIADAIETRSFDRAKARRETVNLIAERLHTSASPVRLDIAPSIIEIDAISKTFPGSELPALERISLAIARSSIVAIVGESGSGKTTLGRLLVGLLRPSSGEILVKGRIQGKLHNAKVIQMVFQDPATSLDEDRSVSLLLTETMRVNGIGATSDERRQLAIELLLKVGLSSSAIDGRPAQFSGGERQRIAIARALSARPEILVCDESVSALDTHLRNEILTLLSNLRRDMGLTILFITHNLDLVRNFADEIMVLKDGKLIEKGAIGEIFRKPGSDYTRRLMAAQYRLPDGM